MGDYQSQFALWCMCGVPLMLGCDVRSMDTEILKLVTDPRLIAINQDKECRQPMFLGNAEKEDKLVVFKHLENGYAVAFVNFSERDRDMSLSFTDVGLTAASGMGFEFTPVIGELSGKYLEYVSLVVPPRSCVVALANTFRA